MAKSDHEAAKGGEGGKKGSMLLMADKKPAVMPKPGNGALHNPAVTIAAKRAAILSLRTIGTIGRDHFDTQLRQGLIKRITVVSLVTDQALRAGLLLAESESLLHHGSLADVRRVDGEGQWNTLSINNKLQFCSLSFTGQADTVTASFGGGKRRINKTLVEAHSPLINQIANDGREDFSENIRLAPSLQIVMDRAFGRKSSRQVLPLNTGVQNEQNRLENLPLACPRPPILTLARSLQNRPQNLPLIIAYEHSLS